MATCLFYSNNNNNEKKPYQNNTIQKYMHVYIYIYIYIYCYKNGNAVFKLINKKALKTKIMDLFT